MSALPPKAEIGWVLSDVRFVLKADICAAANSRYSITSSARARADGGMARPSALAVLRLILVRTWSMPELAVRIADSGFATS
jgi:hypothetical protein